jgi:hypothetical protein
VTIAIVIGMAIGVPQLRRLGRIRAVEEPEPPRSPGEAETGKDRA